MGIPVLDEIISSAAFIWSVLPTPFRVVIGIALVSLMLGAFNLAVLPVLDAATNQQASEALTIGAKSGCGAKPVCEPNSIEPELSRVEFLGFREAVSQCVDYGYSGYGECAPHYYPDVETNEWNGSAYLRRVDSLNSTSACLQTAYWCEATVSAAWSQLVNGGLWAFGQFPNDSSGTCQPTLTDDVLAWKASCADRGGIYLLHPLLVPGICLMAYGGMIVLKYYSAGTLLR